MKQLEPTRRKYRPHAVRILLVGEGPPASGRSFYNEDSGLYRAVRQSFLIAFPYVAEGHFLDRFSASGCYLVDLCGFPVDDLEHFERIAARRRGEPRLTEILLKTSPEALVTVVKSTLPNVGRAIESAEWHGALLSLPYPGRWSRYRKVFVDRLAVFFRERLSQKANA